MVEILYDYSKLKGKIKEKYDTQINFAKAMGISEPTIIKKLKCQVYFTQPEITKATKLLGISENEVMEIFFTEKSFENQN